MNRYEPPTRTPKDQQDLVDFVLEGLDKVPGPVREKIREKFQDLKELVLESRPPRILVLGRRGAGKSSLVNAIFQEKVAEVGDVVAVAHKPEWRVYNGSSGSLEICDTRGLGDRIKPGVTDLRSAVEEIEDAFEDRMPDVLLFLCKASEVDAHVEVDIRLTQQVLGRIQAKHDYHPPVVGLVTKVDELAPLRITEPPYDDPAKQEAIVLACATLRDAFTSHGIELEKILPVSAYAEYEGDRAVYRREWNVAELVEYLVAHMPKSARLMLARAAKIRTMQKRLARNLTKSAAGVCATIALEPIPVADIIPITATQVLMVCGIAFVSGRRLSKDAAKEFMGAMGLNLGAAVVLREVARGLLKLLPGAGTAINAGVAGIGTYALGEAAILYFIDGTSAEAARSRLTEVLRRRRTPSESATA